MICYLKVSTRMTYDVPFTRYRGFYVRTILFLKNSILGYPLFNPKGLFQISVNAEVFPFVNTNIIIRKYHRKYDNSLEMVYLMINHIYPFLGSRGQLGSTFWQANDTNILFIKNFFIRRSVIELSL